MTKLSIATIISLLTLIGGAYAWDFSQRQQTHQDMSTHVAMADIELDLQRINLELKLLRTIRERRPLTPDEDDRLNYLIQLRGILREKQQREVNG